MTNGIGGARMSPLSGAWQDLRQAARTLGREPRAAVFIVLTLALGIGSVSAMFGVADRLFLSGPPHVRAPEELVRVYLRVEDGGGRRTSPWIPLLTARAIDEGVPGFSGFTLYQSFVPGMETLGRIGDDVSRFHVVQVDENYFDVLGVAPYAGRFFGADADDGEGGPVVISYAVARSHFGDPSSALNRTIQLGSRHRTVVAVAPERFSGPHLGRIDAWVPIERALIGNRNWWVVGRLAERTPGDLARLSAQAQAVHTRTDPGRSFRWARDGTVTIAELSSDDAGAMSAEASVARLLLALVGLLLLIACANVVNLLLARITRRRQEVVVRLALGIGHWRLIRLLIFESLLLGIAGGLFGVAVAYGDGLVLRRVLLPEIAWGTSPVDVRVLAVTALVAALVGVMLGLLPARHAYSTDLTSGLASERVASGRGRTRTHGVLATAQLTLASALLLCAGLFLASFRTIRVTDLGFDGGVLAVELSSLAPGAIKSGSDEERQLYQRAAAAAGAVVGPGRSAVAVGLPFLYNFGLSIWIDGRDSIPDLPGGGPYVSTVSGGYFEAVGTPILRGVGISAEDVARGEPVVVISRSTAETLWPDGGEMGACIRFGSRSDECLRVIGVAADVHRSGYREPPSFQAYVPLGMEQSGFSTMSFSGMSLIVRPGGDAAGQIARLSAALRQIDPVVDHVDATRIDSVVDDQVRPWRLGAVVLTLTAGIALLLSLVGVYGVLSYGVAQRKREIGVRLALGATKASIQRLVLRTGTLSAVVGVTAGVTLVLGGSRWLAPLLFETSVADPVVLGAVAVLLVVSAVVACMLPAAEAARVDAMTSLRGEG